MIWMLLVNIRRALQESVSNSLVTAKRPTYHTPFYNGQLPSAGAPPALKPFPSVYVLMGNSLFVGAVVQGDLGQFQAEAHPIGRDVIEVVEVEAAEGDGAQPTEVEEA